MCLHTNETWFTWSGKVQESSKKKEAERDPFPCFLFLLPASLPASSCSLLSAPSSNNPSVGTMSRDGGAVIAWKEHNYKVKLVRNGKQHFPHIQECSTRDTFTLLSTTIHKQGIWKRNPTLPGQVCNNLGNAAISTYFTSVINYCAKGWESGEPYFILQAQQVLLI